MISALRRKTSKKYARRADRGHQMIRAVFGLSLGQEQPLERQIMSIRTPAFEPGSGRLRRTGRSRSTAAPSLNHWPTSGNRPIEVYLHDSTGDFFADHALSMPDQDPAIC